MTVPTPHVARPIAPTPLATCHTAPTDVSHPHIVSRPEQANFSLNPSSTFNSSHSTAHVSSSNAPPPRKKRSRRCFVCGGTGKHRLNPRFCPRTYELLSKRLVKFNADFRLVSDDGSPLPMTRHPGGVAAHLLLPRRFPPRTFRVAPRSVSKSPGGSHSNPPHVHRAPHASPIPVPRSVPNTIPASNSNPPHAPPAVVEHPRRISSPDWHFESNPPYFPREEHSSSPPFRILIPIPDSHPPSETPLVSLPRHDNSFILEIFDCLIPSPSWRRALAALIDSINRLNMDNNIPVLRKYVEPLRDHVKTFVPFV
jgi:hypothetical protein